MSSNKGRLYRFLIVTLGPLARLILHAKYINPKQVPKSGAYILASNHIADTDPIVMAIGQRRMIHFMAKAELFKNRFLSRFFKAVGAFPVERGKHDISSVHHFEDLMRNGEVMGIFIEGTRSKTGDFLSPKNGVSLIAFDTKTPVIPVCLTKIGRKTVCHFGEVLSLEEIGLINGGAREYRNASRIIMEKIKELREQDIAQ